MTIADILLSPKYCSYAYFVAVQGATDERPELLAETMHLIAFCPSLVALLGNSQGRVANSLPVEKTSGRKSCYNIHHDLKYM